MSVIHLTQPLLFLLVLCGCAKDPILAAVDEMDAAESAEQSGRPSHPDGPVKPGKPGEEPPPGDPGEPGEPMSPGIPEEPTPGIPDQPEPRQPGAPEGVPNAVFGDDTGDAGTPEKPARGLPEEPTPVVPDEPTPAEPGAPAPDGPDGEKAPMLPGVPDEPTPASPGSPGGSAHKDKSEQPIDGPQVRIRGRISSTNPVQGKVRIDVFDGDHRDTRKQGNKRISHILVHEIERPSWFEISIPLTYQRVWIGAYGDLNDNKRPDRGEPVGWYRSNPVQLSGTPPTVFIDLVVETKATGLGLDFGGQ